MITLSGASTLTLVVGTPFVDPGATCTDNYDSVCIVTQSGTVNTSTGGSYILTYSSLDASGNRAIEIQRIVNVVASLVVIPPVITLSGASTMNIAIGSTFIDPGATCVDDIDSICTVTTTGSVNTSLSGAYLVSYHAVDSAGNLALPVTRIVRVSDLTPPHMTLSGASTMNIGLGSIFIDPGATCIDDVDMTCIVSITGSVNTNQIGNYLVYYSSIDNSGNSSVILTRTVNVYQIVSQPSVPVIVPSPSPSPSLSGHG